MLLSLSILMLQLSQGWQTGAPSSCPFETYHLPLSPSLLSQIRRPRLVLYTPGSSLEICHFFKVLYFLLVENLEIKIEVLGVLFAFEVLLLPDPPTEQANRHHACIYAYIYEFTQLDLSLCLQIINACLYLQFQSNITESVLVFSLFICIMPFSDGENPGSHDPSHIYLFNQYP